jgi:hypothetical protein
LRGADFERAEIGTLARGPFFRRNIHQQGHIILLRQSLPPGERLLEKRFGARLQWKTSIDFALHGQGN